MLTPENKNELLLEAEERVKYIQKKAWS